MPAFMQPLPQVEARRQLKLDVNRPVILVLGGIFGPQIAQFIAHDLDITVSSIDKLRQVEATAARLKGQRVTIVQDVIASGGTAQALARLVERAGGTVQGYLAAFKQGESRLPVTCLQELPTRL